MKKLFFFSFILATILSANRIEAQVKKPAAKQTAGNKPTPPKLRTFLGNMIGGNSNVDGMVSLVQQPLVIKDDKGNNYTVVKFSFSWTTKDIFEDPETGEKKSHTNNFTRQVNGTEISADLKETLTTEIKPGDFISYDQILVKNKDGLKFLAPSISFTVK